MELAAPIYVDTRAALDAWIEHLARAEIIAVDTESDSLHHFREKVCLVQMTALGKDALLDPLALDGLGNLGEIFADPSKTKIFHDAGYDLISLGRDFGYRVRGIFDTMLATRLLGHKEFGLATILKQRFGFVADKRLQRSDWARRPLTEAQISYARYDTHFLPELAAQLEAELRARGRLTWAEEEFARLPEVASRAAPRPAGPDPDGFWRIRGVRALSPAAKGRARALYAMRDVIAARLDRPKFKVLGDPIILELAQDPPATLDDLPRPGLRRAGVDRFGAEIMRALEAAGTVHGGPPPGSGRRRRAGRFLDSEVRDRFDALRALRRAKAEQLGVDPEVALGNAVLEELARRPPAALEDLQGRPELRGWRQSVFAHDIFDCLRSPRNGATAEDAGDERSAGPDAGELSDHDDELVAADPSSDE